MTETQNQMPTEAAGAVASATANAVVDGFHEDESIDTMYLTFPIDGESYGVPISMVTEIVGMQRVMSVPDMPHYIRGVINLRGKVIPLMDVRARFSLPERPHDDRTVVIVLDVNGAPIGLIVDGVSEVVDITDDKVDRSGGFGGGGVVAGLGHVGDRVAILLDVPVMVGDDDVRLPDNFGA